jgi:hypothetical protein
MKCFMLLHLPIIVSTRVITIENLPIPSILNLRIRVSILIRNLTAIINYTEMRH